MRGFYWVIFVDLHQGFPKSWANVIFRMRYTSQILQKLLKISFEEKSGNYAPLATNYCFCVHKSLMDEL